MMKKLVLLVFSCVLAFSFQSNAMTLTSPSFKDGEKLPGNSGYEKGNISPELNWSEIPEGTVSFAIIVDDPDAKGWTHWVVYNIPLSETKLKKNFPKSAENKDGTRQGTNDFNGIGYGGPSPPSGTHRYDFRLYALDIVLDLKPGASKKALLKAIEGHVLAEAKLYGKYSK